MIRSARRAWLMIGALAAAAVTAGVPAAGSSAPALAATSTSTYTPAAPATACQRWTGVPTPATDSLDVRAVATLSARNVWVVGDIFHAGVEQSLIEH
jgi:hypothetical protein